MMQKKDWMILGLTAAFIAQLGFNVINYRDYKKQINERVPISWLSDGLYEMM